METRLTSRERIGLLSRVSPEIAQDIGRALKKLTNTDIRVNFSGIRSFNDKSLIIETGEKCFGAYMRFKDCKGDFEGIILAIFPVSAIKVLLKLLIRRYSGKLNKEKINERLKLSAFKEAANIIISRYISGVANMMNCRFNTGVPEFVCFTDIEFVRPALLKTYKTVSMEQFSIKGEGSTAPVRGRFVIVF